MSYQNIAKAKAIERKNKEKFLKLNPELNEKSGIYFLTREDENGIKFAYIGQARQILTRLAQHLVGYQHIDLSLKKHGLYSEDNIYGWKVFAINYELSELNEKERYYIKMYANHGYQLRNKTAGGQDEGKAQIDEYKPRKGYRDGIEQGRKALARELKDILEKHLIIELKPEKKANKTSQRMFEKFMWLLDEKNYESEGNE